MYFKLVNIFPECPKYFFRMSQVVNTSSSFRTILNGVTMLVDIPEGPKYFFRLPQVVKTSTKFRMILKEVTKIVDLPECPKHFS